MKYEKHIALIVSLFTIAWLIFKAASDNNYMVAGFLALVFFTLSFLGLNLKVKKFKIDADDKYISVNGDDDEPKN